MKISQGDEQPVVRALEFRAGTTHLRQLLDGEPGSRGNFTLGIWRSEGDFYSPRHHHNFDQFRVVLDGELNYGVNGKLTKGMIGYFPEGVMYGPQSQEPGKFSLALILQFGATSGSGFQTQSEVEAAEAELKKFGEFEKGVFRRTAGPGKKNMDAMQAIWEHINNRPMVYPKPRLINPAFMDPENYGWSQVEGSSDVGEKLLAVQSDRGAESRIVKLNAGARYRFTGRAVFYVMSGKGTVAGEPLREMTSFYLDSDESTEIVADEAVEVLQLGMPRLVGSTGSAELAAA